MCKYLFTGQSLKYKYLLDENKQASIVDKKTGEIITDPERVKKIFSELAAAFVPSVADPAEPQKKKHKYGVYGRVLLTENELNRLYDELGQKEANSCINYVDELAETNGNKYKWKNWNLVVRKCHREQWHKRTTEYEETPTSYDMDEFQKKAERLPEYKKADR